MTTTPFRGTAVARPRGVGLGPLRHRVLPSTIARAAHRHDERRAGESRRAQPAGFADWSRSTASGRARERVKETRGRPARGRSSIRSASAVLPRPADARHARTRPAAWPGSGSSSAVTAWCSPTRRRRRADEVTVMLTDQREFRAKVVAATRPPTSRAQIDAKDCPRCGSATRRRLRVGDWVVAIGTPYVSQHVTSDRQREIRALPGDAVGRSSRPMRPSIPATPAPLSTRRRGGRHQLADLQPQWRLPGLASRSRSTCVALKDEIHSTAAFLTAGSASTSSPSTRPWPKLGLEGPRARWWDRAEGAAPRARTRARRRDLKYDGKAIEPRRIAGDGRATRPHEGRSRYGATQGQKLEVEVRARCTEAIADASDVAGRGKLGVAVRPLTAAERQKRSSMRGRRKCRRPRRRPACSRAT